VFSNGFESDFIGLEVILFDFRIFSGLESEVSEICRQHNFMFIKSHIRIIRSRDIVPNKFHISGNDIIRINLNRRLTESSLACFGPFTLLHP